MTFAGYDSVASTAEEWRQVVPVRNPQVIGSYRNGRFANDLAAREAFPAAIHISYDVNGSRPDADLLDVEPGDAFPVACPGWCRRWALSKVKRALARPGLYQSASSTSTVLTVMLDSGFKRTEFLIHSAHFTFGAHICGPDTCGFPQADGTQYADHGLNGQNTDLNLFADHFFGKVPAPRHDPHYGYFDAAHRVLLAGRSERGIVREYDKWRATQTLTRHPHRLRLALLRAQCRLAAMRLRTLGSGSQFHRDWRIRELDDRARGERRV